MTSPTERGLFERIEAQILLLVDEENWHSVETLKTIKDICADHEQQLAAAQSEAARQEKDYITAATRASFLDIEVQQLTDQLAEADESLRAVESALADVNYSGPYAEGVRLLKQQRAAAGEEVKVLKKLIAVKDKGLLAACTAMRLNGMHRVPAYLDAEEAHFLSLPAPLPEKNES